jgi:hypothetical protein
MDHQSGGEDALFARRAGLGLALKPRIPDDNQAWVEN